MDSRQVAFVRAALADELAFELPAAQLDRLAEIAVKATLNWMIGAAQEGMIESVHVSSEDPRDA
jgi:hypothetical protein